MTLTLAFWFSVVVGVFTLISAVIAITTGKEHIRQYVIDEVKDTVGSDITGDLDSLVGSELDDVYRTLMIKSVVAIVFALVVLLFAIVARNAGTGARIGLTVALAAVMCGGNGLLLADPHALPNASLAISGLVQLLGLLAIIMTWLPATNRYAQARKIAR